MCAVRWLIPVATLLMSCGEPPLVAHPLPPLQAPEASPPAAGRQRGFWRPGERMVWNVRFKGLAVGRAELLVGDDFVKSRFRADKLFAQSVDNHDLTTELVPQSSGAHTIHSAVGWLRAWAEPGAPARSLRVDHLGDAYDVDVASPMVEVDHGGTLRIEAQAAPPDDSPIVISVWLSRDERRAPVRFELSRGVKRVTGTLVGYEH